MERNTLTTIDRLKTGDRFYKANDRRKEIYHKVEKEPIKTAYQTYKNFGQKNGYDPLPMKSNTQVVFLRHSESL